MKTRTFSRTMIAVALSMLSTLAYAADDCSAAGFCTETSTFAAALTNFRTSATDGGANRVLSATIRFQNKADRPLILGYVDGSGVALDEHGNRYTLRARDVRGIGSIERRTFDPKFTLRPGERSDARVDLRWHAGRNIAGVQFDLELTVREIDEVTGNQHRLGKEHVLRFAGLSDGAGAASAALAANHHSDTAVASTTTNAAAADPCTGIPNCYAAGPFVAEIVQLAPNQPKNNAHVVRVGVRFRNVSNQPLILAYQSNSGTMLDNYGQQYGVDWRSNANVSGIGQSTRNKADPQFVLSPGESRTASFNYSRYVGKSAIGTIFSPELVVEQLEILPSQQIRSTRDYAVSFINVSSASLGASTYPGATPGHATEAIEEINEAGRRLSEGLKGLFKKK